MYNKALSGFLRNNYFKGKPLTVRDFKDEQNYNIDKKRLTNLACFGTGVVAGLEVVAIDNNAISIESGYAVDDLGHDIFIGMPIFKNINMTDGYEDLDDKKSAYLCLEYNESPVEPTYSVSDNDSAFNRVREDYHIFLTNKKPLNENINPRSLVETTTEIFNSNGIIIRLTVPKYVKIGDTFEITAEIEKRNIYRPVAVNCVIESEAFTDENDNLIEISYYSSVNKNERSTQKLRLKSKVSSETTAALKITKDSLKVTIDNAEVISTLDSSFEIKIISEKVEDKIKELYFQLPFDNFSEFYQSEPIYLAEMNIVKIKNSCYIENIIPMPFNQYVLSSRLQYLISAVTEQKTAQDKDLNVIQNTAEKQTDTVSREKITASGIETIEIKTDMKGKVFYSSEIIHGLGSGNVSYEISVEATDSGFSGANGTVLFGSAHLFEGSPYNLPFPCVQHSIISYNDKGTFRIAVRLLDKINSGIVKVHWYAVKYEENYEKSMLDVDNVSIQIKPNLVNIKPREKIAFECIIEGSSDLNCIWSVDEKSGGSIDQNGLYEAPSAEGVYTVTAASVKYPVKKAVNYVIVSRNS